MNTLPTIRTDQLSIKIDDSGKRRELLTPLPTEGDFLLVLDNSAIETFTTCPRYSFYHEVLSRQAHARNASLSFGGACHVGWEHIERDEGRERTFESPTGEPDLRVWNEVDTAQRVLEYFSNNPTPPDEYRTPAATIELLAHYRVRKALPDYHWDVHSDKDGLLVERPFEIPIGVLEVGARIHLPRWESPRLVKRIFVAWAGRIDLMVRPAIHPVPHVADNKTTSIAGDNFTQDFQLNNATVGYVWAANKLWPELAPINDFCVNAAHLKKPAAGKGLMDIGPRGGEPALKFFRSYFHYSKERLDRWEENTMFLVEDFVSCLIRGTETMEQGFPLKTKWCFGKYGKCQYHDACTVDDYPLRMRILMSDMFQDVTWNPTAER